MKKKYVKLGYLHAKSDDKQKAIFAWSNPFHRRKDSVYHKALHLKI